MADASTDLAEGAVQPAARVSLVQRLSAEAESLWAAGDREGSLAKFDEAILLKTPERDMLLVGKGHSLLGMQRWADAKACFDEALLTAETDAQRSFLTNFVEMAAANIQPSKEDIVQAAGLHSARRLVGAVLPDGGVVCDGLLPPAAAAAGGCGDGEGAAESHCQSHQLEGFNELENKLIVHVAEHGVDGSWAELAEEVEVPESSLRATWERIAPNVQATLETQPDMPCGHTCNTCPTKDTCKLHDVLDDLENIAASS